MTRREAIKGLKNLFGEHELDLPCTDSLNILTMAIEALGKQIPKKIKTIVKNISRTEAFDREVNEALMDGWRLEKRMIVQDEEDCMLYAELVKEVE